MKTSLKNLLLKLIEGNYGEYFRYFAVGCVTIGINFVIYFILYDLFNMDVSVGNSIAIVVSNAYSYFGNKRHVFRTHCENKRALLKEMASFFSLRACSMLLEGFGVPAVIKSAGDHELLAKLEVVIVVVAINFLVNKFIIFYKKKTGD